MISLKKLFLVFIDLFHKKPNSSIHDFFPSNRTICYFGLILTYIIWNVRPFMEKKDKFWSGTILAIQFVENLFFWLFMVIMSIGLAETVILLVESTNLLEMTSHWLNLKFFICLH